MAALEVSSTRNIKRASIRLTLVVPMRNEERSLPALLSSISGQSVQPDRIILVDGGSTDGTVDLAKMLIADHSNYQVIEAGDATPGRGRNIGVEAANTEWIAFTDAGIEPDRQWVEKLVEIVERTPNIDVVYGNYDPMTDTFFEKCAALSYPPAKQQRPGGLMRGPSVASMLLRRKVWQAVGGFPDLRAAEDLIFMQQIERSGFKIGWAPQATVRWQLQPTLARTFRKFVLYSKHNVWAGWQRYWHYGIARQYLIAAPFLALGLFYNPWWFLIPLAGWAARTAKSIWTRREGRGLFWMLSPARFACIMIILATIDLATFVGWVQALITEPTVNPGHWADGQVPETQRDR